MTLSTTKGLATKYRVDSLLTGDEQRTQTQPDSTKTVTLIKTNGEVLKTEADGTQISQLQGPDPRFGMEAPEFTNSLTALSGGLSLNLQTERTANVKDVSNPLSLTTMTDKLTVNGRVFTSIYDAITKTATHTSAGGRKSSTTIDNLGRVLQSEVTGILATNLTYDPKRQAYQHKPRFVT